MSKIHDTGVKLNERYRNAEVYTKIAGAWVQTIPYKKANGIWRQNFAHAEIPAGAILPLRGAGSVPADWTLFTAADDRYIVGAGSTYVVGQTGSTGNITVTVATDGDHFVGSSGFRGGASSWAGPDVDPGHDHATTLLGTASWSPYYLENRLIQANIATTILPQDAVVFNAAAGIYAGMTQENTVGDQNRYFKSNTAAASGGNLSASFSLTANPTHTHGTPTEGGSTGGSQGGNWKGQAPAVHTHAASPMTITPDLYRVIMSAWYKASGSIDINNFSNPIIMYDNVNPPPGWYLCDGNNGTPDMRDYFVRVAKDAVTEIGDAKGDGNVSGTGTSSSDGNHDHDNNDKCGDCYSDNAYHAAIGGSHTHGLSFDSTWLPSFYGLAFMMKI